MKTKKSLLVILFLFTAIISFSQDKDFGIWYSVGAETKVVKNLELDIDASIRTFENAAKIEEAFFDIGLTYIFNKYLSAAASYRFTEFREDDNSYHPRHKWFADLKGKVSLSDFDISARLRFQQRYKTYFEDDNDTESKNTARIKLQILYDIPSFPLNPYISAELFIPIFDDIERSVEKKRVMFGVSYSISKKHLIEAEYIFQRDYFPELSDMNIISLNYQFRF